MTPKSKPRREAPITEDALARLRAEASRDDYASMALLAEALYADGFGPREVLRECYGVDFPEEFFVVAEARPQAEDLVDFYDLPWELAVPPERGGPAPPTGPMLQSEERRILARDPDLLPLGYLWEYNPMHSGGSARHGSRVLCYRLGELWAGRTTVFGVPYYFGVPDDFDGKVVRCGDLFLEVLYEYHSDRLGLVRYEYGLPSNRGAGSLDAEHVNEALSMLEWVEELQHRLAAREET